MKRSIYAVLIIAKIIMLPVTAQSEDSLSLIFLPGEELQYSVRWKFIRLGTITITRLDNGSDENTFRVSMLVESNPSLPFVDIREYNETLIDASTLMTIEFYGDYRNRRSRVEKRQIYDADNNLIYHLEWDSNSGEHLLQDTIYNASAFVNGPSLFSYTRALATSQGLSCDFTGWISDDLAAVPIRAEMKVLLGSVEYSIRYIRVRFTRSNFSFGSSLRVQ